jgi:hypothetical protein
MYCRCFSMRRLPPNARSIEFLSTYPRVPDDGRDRALDGGRQEVAWPMRARAQHPMPMRWLGVLMAAYAQPATQSGGVGTGA